MNRSYRIIRSFQKKGRRLGSLHLRRQSRVSGRRFFCQRRFCRQHTARFRRQQSSAFLRFTVFLLQIGLIQDGR
ncbi:hypothetical protein HanIR_Chr15g0780941 [Helianthus annuus]|nr:hypothetical protein HanIR_Chr15g0780941 [Helianthus annuus]